MNQQELSRLQQRIRNRLRSLAWEFLNKFVKPLILVAAALSLLLVFSVLLYSWFRHSVLPKALISEALHFDFTMVKPTARVNLFSGQHQWYYSNDVDNYQSLKDDDSQTMLSSVDKVIATRTRFLKPKISYSVDAVIFLSKSPRNVEMGKFMMGLTLFNSMGETVARSNRLVPVPYQSTITLSLDSIFLYPARLLGFAEPPETTFVRVHFMNDYVEPPLSTIPTQYLEFHLSTDRVDLVSTHVTVMPTLRGLS